MHNKCWAIIATMVALSCAGLDAASAACIPINSQSDLKRISNNMAGHYCLTADIMLSEPLEPLTKPFTGSFNGNGYTIRGLTIDGQRQNVGLFARIHGGRVSNVTLAAVSVTSATPLALVGAVAGLLSGDGTIDNVHVSGLLTCRGGCFVGGIVGQVRRGTIQNSSSNARVRGSGIPGLDFSATLATLVKDTEVYTFLPISQREPMEYGGNPVNTKAASLAAVYTMIARAIGRTQDDPQLEAALIDGYFWNDATKTATWQGPVTSYANLQTLITLPEPATINNSNILGALKNDDLVILQGSLPTGEKHWMLATLFRTNSADVATRVVANDPWTGKQVLISVNTRRVTTRGFPLNFKVDAYQTVQLN